MKAVVIHALGGPDQLTLAEMPDPVPGAGEVLLDVAYAGCNWADTQVRVGIYPHPMTYPTVLGFEVSERSSPSVPTSRTSRLVIASRPSRRREAPMPRNASPTRVD